MKHDLAILAFSLAACAVPAQAKDRCKDTFDQLYVSTGSHLHYVGCFDGTRIEFRREDVCPYISTQIKWHQRLIEGSGRRVSEKIINGLRQNERARQDYCEEHRLSVDRFYQWNVG